MSLSDGPERVVDRARVGHGAWDRLPLLRRLNWQMPSDRRSVNVRDRAAAWPHWLLWGDGK